MNSGKYDEGCYGNASGDGDLSGDAPESLEAVNSIMPEGEKVDSVEIGKYYGNALLSYLLMIERRPYFIEESLTGHDIRQASAIGHRKLYPSIGFDYGKALEKFGEITGKNDPFKKLILMAKLCRFAEKRNALL